MNKNKKYNSLHKFSLIGIVFSVVLGLNGCGGDDNLGTQVILPPPVAITPEPAPTFTPFERIATLDVITVDGAVDYQATYAKVQEVADTIHTYIESVNGADEDVDTIGDAILAIPSTDLIDPGLPASKANTYKVQVMDICNSYYAKKALGFSEIVAGDPTSKVANGFIHAPTLPCEVSVYNDADNIYIDMLNPDAIFSLFFSDVVFGTQMDDATFADEITKLPGLVKSELKTIVYAALDGASYSYTALSEKLGPAFTQDEILDTVDSSPYDSPYLHFSYMKTDGTVFTNAEVSAVAQTIINTMSIGDEPGAGTHDPVLDTILSPGSSWRSARAKPLGLPGVGGFKNYVIEACSPKYAKMALATGRHHAPALPCEISITAIEGSSGSGVYDTMMISFLEPGFMFNVLFSDAFGSMTEAELLKYSALPPTVLQDLQNIVNYSLGVDLSVAYSLTSSNRVTYDMMPN